MAKTGTLRELTEELVDLGMDEDGVETLVRILIRIPASSTTAERVDQLLPSSITACELLAWIKHKIADG